MFEVCLVGDDIQPPWNHASSILAKRLAECLAGRAKIQVATILTPELASDWPTGTKAMLVSGSPGKHDTNAVRLGRAVRGSTADIVHLIGTNALVFSPFCRLPRTRKRIIRHIFTSYDNKDRIIRPARRLINRLFIDGYAFTTPWMRDWALDAPSKRFLIRPPIDCSLYRPKTNKASEILPRSLREQTILYMGPLLGSRFPVISVLSGLKLLARSGLDFRFVVLTSARRTTPQQAAKLAALGTTLGIDNRFFVRRADLTELERVEAYNSADVVIFPFVGPVPEKLADPPFGLLEAMACGRIVLGTCVLSIPEVVDDGKTGFLIEKATSEQIHNGLLRALTSPDLVEIARNARQKIVKVFSYPRVSEAALEAYDSLLSRGKT